MVPSNKLVPFGGDGEGYDGIRKMGSSGVIDITVLPLGY